MGEAKSVVPTGRKLAKSPKDATPPKDPIGAIAVPSGPIVVVPEVPEVPEVPKGPVAIMCAVPTSDGEAAPPFGPTFFMT